MCYLWFWPIHSTMWKHVVISKAEWETVRGPTCRTWKMSQLCVQYWNMAVTIILNNKQVIKMCSHYVRQWLLPRDTMPLRYMLSLCVCTSVCPSHVGIVPKRQNTGACTQCLSKGSPQQRRQVEVGRFKLAIIDQYIAISQKRCKIET